MTELEQLLSDSLKRVAQPGDPTGVLDAVQARVDAGETGTQPPSGGAALRWLPWIGVVLVAAIVGGIAGFTGLFGAIQPASAATLTVSFDHTVSGALCPGGSAFVTLTPAERVLALQRTTDGGWLSVRDPYDLGTTVWVRRSTVVLDHKADPTTLPIGGCPVPTVSATPPPVVDAPAAPEEPSTPGKPAKPAPPADTTAPTVNTLVVTPDPHITCKTTITATASDNVGVTSVTLTWSGTNSGSGSMTLSGGVWSYPLHNLYGGVTTFTAVAHDAAGNSSAPKSASGNLQCLG